MKLGMDVGLGLGHIVLNGDRLPSPKGAQPANFRPMPVVAKRSSIPATAEHLLHTGVAQRSAVVFSAASVCLFVCLSAR